MTDIVVGVGGSGCDVPAVVDVVVGIGGSGRDVPAAVDVVAVLGIAAAMLGSKAGSGGASGMICGS